LLRLSKEYRRSRATYNLADLTIASVTTECSAIRIALLQIQRLILEKKILQSTTARNDHASYILEDFQRVLGACSFTFAALNQRLTSLDLQSASKHNDSTFMAKVKAVWNEDEMALLRNNIRGLSEAIVLLLTVSQA
jgi:hypothetical protein